MEEKKSPLIVPVKLEEAKEEAPKVEERVKTNIDIAEEYMTIRIDLRLGEIIAYGTLEKSKELCSRYFVTKEIIAKQQAAARAQVGKETIDGALGRLKVQVPGRKLH